MYDNYGNKEVSIPKVIVGTANDNTLMWVDNVYLSEGIRPQREKKFESPKEILDQYFLLKRISPRACLVNGFSMEEVSHAIPETGLSLDADLTTDGVSYYLFTDGLVAQ